MDAGKNCWSNDKSLGLLRESDLAARWIVSLRTLQRWRENGSGPPFVRLGGTIRYRMADVLAFEERQRVGGAAR